MLPPGGAERTPILALEPCADALKVGLAMFTHMHNIE